MKTVLLLTLLFLLVSCDDPVLTLNIHPPIEVKEEVEEQIKELGKLEEEEIKSQDLDFMVEKKKLVEAQRVRVKTIVHGSFEAVNSLIPNPIKSAIRAELKKMTGGGGGGGGAGFKEIEDSITLKRNSLVANIMQKSQGQAAPQYTVNQQEY